MQIISYYANFSAYVTAHICIGFYWKPSAFTLVSKTLSYYVLASERALCLHKHNHQNFCLRLWGITSLQFCVVYQADMVNHFVI